MPIRQPGKPWSGMDSLGGRTDDGTGQLNENSVNVTINEVDRLQKRLGFVRGLAERFGTVVCGLHAYVDNCGQQWLLVASDEGVSIRQPFNVPVFENDDSYPTDDFSDEAGLSESNWRNTDLYLATGGALLRTVDDSSTPFDAASFLRWFKNAGAKSYEVTIQYEFNTNVSTTQVCSVVIKGVGDLSSGRRLQLDLSFNASDSLYVAKIYKTDATGELLEIGTLDVQGSLTSPSGFLTLGYERNFTGQLPVLRAVATVVPTGGGSQTFNGFNMTELEDIELGQVSAIGCSQNVSILQVTGGPL